jgi:hypothetical protein
LNNQDLDKLIKSISPQKFIKTAAEKYVDIIEFTNDYLLKIEPSGKKMDLQHNFD